MDAVLTGRFDEREAHQTFVFLEELFEIAIRGTLPDVLNFPDHYVFDVDCVSVRRRRKDRR